MASTYSPNLAIELIGTGDQAGSWGNTTNTNLGTLIEQAVSGYVTQAMTTGNTTTITIPNGATGVARNMYIEMTGTGGTNTFLVVPANKKLYFIYNNTSGAVTVKVSGQTGVSVAAGVKTILVSNGTDVVAATSFLTSVDPSLTVTTLNATSANITTLTGTTSKFTNTGDQATTQFQGASANITTITGTTIGASATTQFQGASANITTITGTTIGTTASTQLRGASASITTVTGTTSTFTTTSDGVGNIRQVPRVGAAKTSVYTLSISDVGQYVELGTGGGIDVPNGVFSTGDVVSIFNNTTAARTISLTITTAYISGTDTDKNSVSLATRGVATVLFISNSVCVVTGSVT